MKLSLKMLIGTFAVIGVVSTGAIVATPVLAQSQETDVATAEAKAKVTPVQAMKAAEGKVGGKAAMAIFEFDEGHWIYGVVVVKDKKLMEVDVDPITGKAGDSEAVNPEDEGKEFQQELAKLIK
ncbi:MAG: PepSY domain-containing protein [Armatimonadetes bacterium]|nr:PepSY domain-containing protein [Armatimonadota bacterium]